MIACFLSNISAKYYKNPSMLSRVIAKNVGDVFFWDTVYIMSDISHLTPNFVVLSSLVQTERVW